MAAEPLLRAEGLEVVVPARGGSVTPVVDRVSLTLAKGERLALIGESGSGKSLTALAILGLAPEPAELRSGRVSIEGVETDAIEGFRGGVIGLVMQEAASALNPVFGVGRQIVETLATHGIARGEAARRRALELLDEVALEHPEAMFDAYPHQLSGGQAQRVMIALALAGDPRVVIADEPTTALDVVTQAQILDLLVRITDTRGLGLILISHDLAVVSGLVHRVVVLDRGRVVEEGPVAEILRDPSHDATRRMVEAALQMHSTGAGA